MNKKFNFIYFSFLLVGLAAISLSNSGTGAGGQDGNVSGHPNDGGTCRNCHSGGLLNNPTGSITLTGVPSSIAPSTTYTLTLTVNDLSAPAAGFHILACSGESSNTNIGTFTAQSGATRVTSSGRLVHAPKKASVSNATSWTFNWTSPASPPASTSFYYVGNAVDNNNSLSGADDVYTGVVSNIVLGVDFADLKAETKTNNDVILTWATLTEQNNSHFVVERSMGEKTVFEAIGEIKGTGNSNSKKVYIFTDNTSKNNDFTAQYRIKQVDNDGKESFSKILSATAVGLKNTATVFPTLLQRGQNIQIEKKGSFLVQIFDVTGGLITTLQNQENSTQMSSENLAKGTYFLKIQGKNSIETKKITVQ